MDLSAAQHAVSATLLWHLRVLAGWGPPLGAHHLRLLASEFEIANVASLLDEIRGGAAQPRFSLGSLALLRAGVSGARSTDEVRRALRSSPWGDPTSDDPDGIRLAMQFARTRMIVDSLQAAEDWAVVDASLLLSEVVANDALGELSPSALRDARVVLGDRWQRVTSLVELAGLLPEQGRALLSGVAEPEGLWRAGIRRWTMLEASSAGIGAGAGASAADVVRVAAALHVDAWRVRAALSLAALGGGDLEEAIDAAA